MPEKEPFLEEAPPFIDLGIIEKAEKKKAAEAKREIEVLIERPVDMPVGDDSVLVKPFTFDKMMFFQDLYFSTLGKLQGLAKATSIPDSDNVGDLLTQMGAMRKEIFEAALLLGALVLEPTSEDKDIDLKNLSYPPEKLRRKITPGQLSFVINKGFELAQTDTLQKKILGVNA